MGDLVRQKFQDPELSQLLAGTGDKLLINGNTYGDTQWGATWNKNQQLWTGQNELGKILSDVRQEINQEAPTYRDPNKMTPLPTAEQLAGAPPADLPPSTPPRPKTLPGTKREYPLISLDKAREYWNAWRSNPDNFQAAMAPVGAAVWGDEDDNDEERPWWRQVLGGALMAAGGMALGTSLLSGLKKFRAEPAQIANQLIRANAGQVVRLATEMTDQDAMKVLGFVPSQEQKAAVASTLTSLRGKPDILTPEMQEANAAAATAEKNLLQRVGAPQQDQTPEGVTAFNQWLAQAQQDLNEKLGSAYKLMFGDQGEPVPLQGKVQEWRAPRPPHLRPPKPPPRNPPTCPRPQPPNRRSPASR